MDDQKPQMGRMEIDADTLLACRLVFDDNLWDGGEGEEQQSLIAFF